MRLIFYWVCFSLSEPHTLPKSVITMEQIMGFSLPPSLTCIHSRAPLPSPKGGWMQKCLWCQPISPDLFIRLNQFTSCMLNFSHSVWAPVSKIKRAGGVINPYICPHPKKKKRNHGREGRKCYLWETGELVRVQAGALLAGGTAIVGWTAALASRALFYGTLTIQWSVIRLGKSILQKATCCNSEEEELEHFGLGEK